MHLVERTSPYQGEGWSRAVSLHCLALGSLQLSCLHLMHLSVNPLVAKHLMKCQHK